VLERGGSSLGGREGAGEFVNESVRVESVQEVDVSGRSREN
jgi:hypothetical protein